MFVAYCSYFVPAVPLVPGAGEVVMATILCVEHVCAFVCMHPRVPACMQSCMFGVLLLLRSMHIVRENSVFHLRTP